MKKDYIKPSIYAKYLLKFNILEGSPNSQGGSGATPETGNDNNPSGSTEESSTGGGINGAKGGWLEW